MSMSEMLRAAMKQQGNTLFFYIDLTCNSLMPFSYVSVYSISYGHIIKLNPIIFRHLDLFN